MSAPANAPKPLTPEKVETLTLILRLGGALLIVFGMVMGLDLGGLATKFGLNDGTEESMHQIMGGMIALVGLVDFFVLPAYFKRLHAKNNTSL